MSDIKDVGDIYIDSEIMAACDLTLSEKVVMGAIRTMCKGDNPRAKPWTKAYGGTWYESDSHCARRVNLPVITVRRARRSLTAKGWLSGTKVDGSKMVVKMHEGWYKDRGIKRVPLTLVIPDRGDQNDHGGDQNDQKSDQNDNTCDQNDHSTNIRVEYEYISKEGSVGLTPPSPSEPLCIPPDPITTADAKAGVASALSKFRKTLNLTGGSAPPSALDNIRTRALADPGTAAKEGLHDSRRKARPGDTGTEGCGEPGGDDDA